MATILEYPIVEKVDLLKQIKMESIEHITTDLIVLDENTRKTKSKYPRVQHYRHAWERNPKFIGWLQQGRNSRKAKCIICNSEMTADVSVIKSHSLSTKHSTQMKDLENANIAAMIANKVEEALDEQEREVVKKGFYNVAWESDIRYASWIEQGSSERFAICKVCHVEMTAETAALRRHLATYVHMKAAEYDDKVRLLTMSIAMENTDNSIQVHLEPKDDSVVVHEIIHSENDGSAILAPPQDNLETAILLKQYQHQQQQQPDNEGDALEKLSFLIGKFLLKGYKMLNAVCSNCECVLLQDKKKLLHCVGCQYGLMEEITGTGTTKADGRSNRSNRRHHQTDYPLPGKRRKTNKIGQPSNPRQIHKHEIKKHKILLKKEIYKEDSDEPLISSFNEVEKPLLSSFKEEQAIISTFKEEPPITSPFDEEEVPTISSFDDDQPPMVSINLEQEQLISTFGSTFLSAERIQQIETVQIEEIRDVHMHSIEEVLESEQLQVTEQHNFKREEEAEEEEDSMTEIIINEESDEEVYHEFLETTDGAEMKIETIQGVDLSNEVVSLVTTLQARLVVLTQQLEDELDNDNSGDYGNRNGGKDKNVKNKNGVNRYNNGVGGSNGINRGVNYHNRGNNGLNRINNVLNRGSNCLNRDKSGISSNGNSGGFDEDETSDVDDCLGKLEQTVAALSRFKNL